MKSHDNVALSTDPKLAFNYCTATKDYCISGNIRQATGKVSISQMCTVYWANTGIQISHNNNTLFQPKELSICLWEGP